MRSRSTLDTPLIIATSAHDQGARRAFEQMPQRVAMMDMPQFVRDHGREQAAHPHGTV